MNQRDRFRHLAELLDRLANVPTDVLIHRVISDGQCIADMTSGRPPELTGRRAADQEIAAQVCAACPVQDECLELELRWSGEHTTGVFGALPDEDRRALYPHWRARRAGRGGGRR